MTSKVSAFRLLTQTIYWVCRVQLRTGDLSRVRGGQPPSWTNFHPCVVPLAFLQGVCTVIRRQHKRTSNQQNVQRLLAKSEGEKRKFSRGKSDAEWAGVPEGHCSSQDAALAGFPGSVVVINRFFPFSSLKTYRISNYGSYFPKAFLEFLKERY